METVDRVELLREYRAALRLWSATKTLYPLDSEEIAKVTKLLEDLEKQLTVCANYDEV